MSFVSIEPFVSFMYQLTIDFDTAERVLKIVPGPEPKVYTIGGQLRTGQHRTDGKYKVRRIVAVPPSSFISMSTILNVTFVPRVAVFGRGGWVGW